MITHISVNDFKAVPYLDTSTLMQSHPKGISFSKTKPNIIIGQNGAGKSALLKALALHTMSFYTGRSSLDKNYLNNEYWTSTSSWRRESNKYLEGLSVKSDMAPALFYRPGFLPGDEIGLTHAMMCGYPSEARNHGAMIDKKSSGQQGLALLEEISGILSGANIAPDRYRCTNWDYGITPNEIKNDRFTGARDYQVKILKEAAAPRDGSAPVLMMDEPEQSLDALAEAQLWKLIENADCKKMQIIVSTHSVYPLMHQKKFNLIEATPDYVADVLKLL